jgi:hypothetical protein
MARGTTIDYLTTECKASDVLEDALRMLGVLAPGQKVTEAKDVPRCLRVLNSLLKRDAQDGLHTWSQTEAVLFMTADTRRYTFGTDRVALAADYGRTTLDADEALGQTELSVASTTGMDASDIIGVELDSGTIQWSTISTYSAGATVTINDALTGAAASGNTVYWYTAATTEVPLKLIPGTIRLETSATSEQMIWLVSRQEYMSLPAKTTSGNPNLAFFDRQYNAAYLYLYPVPDDVDGTVRFTFQRQLYDVDTYRDDLDIPPEAAMYYSKALAGEVGLSFGVDPNLVMTIKQEAMQERENLKSAMSLEGSMFIQPVVQR